MRYHREKICAAFPSKVGMPVKPLLKHQLSAGSGLISGHSGKL